MLTSWLLTSPHFHLVASSQLYIDTSSNLHSLTSHLMSHLHFSDPHISDLHSLTSSHLRSSFLTYSRLRYSHLKCSHFSHLRSSLLTSSLLRSSHLRYSHPGIFASQMFTSHVFRSSLLNISDLHIFASLHRRIFTSSQLHISSQTFTFQIITWLFGWLHCPQGWSGSIHLPSYQSGLTCFTCATGVYSCPYCTGLN